MGRSDPPLNGSLAALAQLAELPVEARSAQVRILRVAQCEACWAYLAGK